jgi:hypothetical protein
VQAELEAAPDWVLYEPTTQLVHTVLPLAAQLPAAQIVCEAGMLHA